MWEIKTPRKPQGSPRVENIKVKTNMFLFFKTLPVIHFFEVQERCEFCYVAVHVKDNERICILFPCFYLFEEKQLGVGILKKSNNGGIISSALTAILSVLPPRNRNRNTNTIQFWQCQDFGSACY